MDNSYLHIPIDPELKKEFKRHIGGENLKDAISRLIKSELGWDALYLEQKVNKLKETIQNLNNELKVSEENLQLQLRDNLNYLVDRGVKDDWEFNEKWKGNMKVIKAFREKGITFNFLYNHWEEL